MKEIKINYFKESDIPISETIRYHKFKKYYLIKDNILHLPLRSCEFEDLFPECKCMNRKEMKYED